MPVTSSLGKPRLIQAWSVWHSESLSKGKQKRNQYKGDNNTKHVRLSPYNKNKIIGFIDYNIDYETKFLLNVAAIIPDNTDLHIFSNVLIL